MHLALRQRVGQPIRAQQQPRTQRKRQRAAVRLDLRADADGARDHVPPRVTVCLLRQHLTACDQLLHERVIRRQLLHSAQPDQIRAAVANVQHRKPSAELSIEAAASVKGVPYHPGAAKYFEEKGYKVDAVKEGAGNGTASALSFGTGGESGTYYAFGGVLASFVSGKSDCKVTALTSGGSQANVEDLTNGNVQLAFVQSDVMNYAYNGQRLFDSPVTGFSVVAQLYQEQVQIVTTNPDIKTVADLAGKKVSIGAAGSGVYFNAIDVLSAYDLKESDISAVYQSFGDSAESLKDGKIDAAFIVAGAPTTAITDLATAGSVYLVSLDDSHVQSLLSASPYYTAATIKAGTY